MRNMKTIRQRDVGYRYRQIIGTWHYKGYVALQACLIILTTPLGVQGAALPQALLIKGGFGRIVYIKFEKGLIYVGCHS